jgi:hypothetical protein
MLLEDWRAFVGIVELRRRAAAKRHIGSEFNDLRYLNYQPVLRAIRLGAHPWMPRRLLGGILSNTLVAAPALPRGLGVGRRDLHARNGRIQT